MIKKFSKSEELNEDRNPSIDISPGKGKGFFQVQWQPSFGNLVFNVMGPASRDQSIIGLDADGIKQLRDFLNNVVK